MRRTSPASRPTCSSRPAKEPLPPQLASTLLGLASTLGNDQALLSLIEYVLSGVATSESQPIVLAQMLDNLERRKTSLADLKEVDPQRLARAVQQLVVRIDAARTEIANCKLQIANLKLETVTAALPLLGRVHDQRGEDAKLVGELLVPANAGGLTDGGGRDAGSDQSRNLGFRVAERLADFHPGAADAGARCVAQPAEFDREVVG